MSCCPTEPVKSDIREDVKEYYGKRLKTSDDLQTSACTTPATRLKKHVRDAMKLIHDDVVIKYYGCGLVVPECLEGMSILDLGSGSGHDCYALAKLVGEIGFVTGVDMTDEQLDTANEYVEYHRELFGFKDSNVKFVKGYIEDLESAGIRDSTIDIIISNCVINLCEDKRAVLKEAFRVLKDGGELYFSDMYSDRVPSDEIKSHKVLWGEGISGALHWKELFSLAKEIGFELPRIVSAKVVEVTKPELKEVVGDAKFVSAEYRLFKLPPDVKRETSEITYNGNVTGCEDELQFDRFVKFTKDKPIVVDGDLTAIINCSRFQEEFEIKKAKCCSVAAKGFRAVVNFSGFSSGKYDSVVAVTRNHHFVRRKTLIRFWLRYRVGIPVLVWLAAVLNQSAAKCPISHLPILHSVPTVPSDRLLCNINTYLLF